MKRVDEMQANKAKTLKALEIIEKALLELGELGVNRLSMNAFPKGELTTFNITFNLWPKTIYLDRAKVENFEVLDSHIEQQIKADKDFEEKMRKIALQRNEKDRKEYERLKAKFENS